MEKHAAFQLQIGDCQENCSPHISQFVMPNGHVVTIDKDGWFETIVRFPCEELRTIDWDNADDFSNFEWDMCLKATGSAQLAHRSHKKSGLLMGTSIFCFAQIASHSPMCM